MAKGWIDERGRKTMKSLREIHEGSVAEAQRSVAMAWSAGSEATCIFLAELVVLDLSRATVAYRARRSE